MLRYNTCLEATLTRPWLGEQQTAPFETLRFDLRDRLKDRDTMSPRTSLKRNAEIRLHMKTTRRSAGYSKH